MASELILVRHGQTAWNLAGRLQGHRDSPLTDLGRRQARDQGERLAPLAPGLLVASPLGRARHTARLIAGRLAVPVEHDAALRERGMGILEGLSWEEIAVEHPAEQARRRADPWGWRPPGGESFEDLRRRTAPLLDRLVDRPVERIVVVSHSALARPLLGALLGFDEFTMLDLEVPNDVAYRVRLATPPAVSRLDERGEHAGVLTGALRRTLDYDPRTGAEEGSAERR